MSRKPNRDDDAFTHNEADVDPLGAIYSDLVTPDIEEMTEHANKLAEEKESEPDAL